MRNLDNAMYDTLEALRPRDPLEYSIQTVEQNHWILNIWNATQTKRLIVEVIDQNEPSISVIDRIGFTTRGMAVFMDKLTSFL